MNVTLHLNPIFTDHMVLQRGGEVPVWGEGPEGETVKVCCGERCAEAAVTEGRWQVWLPPMEAGGPYELVVSTSNGESMVLKDIWLGDVWLAGGQSNMEWKLSASRDGEAEIAAAHCPAIRYYDVPKVAYEDGQDYPSSSWKVCSPENAGDYSAVAYYFARAVEKSLSVPVGIVGCNMGATSASCWMGASYLEKDPELRVYLDEFNEQMKNFDWEDYALAEKLFHEAFDAYNRRLEKGLTGEALGEAPWPPPLSPRSFMRPNGLYETMVRKVIPFALKGIIYYQGENDVPKAQLYDKLLEALITNWRTDWQKPDLPFLYVQLPIYSYDYNPDGEQWAWLREAQGKVSERVPNVGMAVTLDCGERDDIHPKDKKPVGERLARIALNRVYGKDVICSGPLPKEIYPARDHILIHYEHVGEGLHAAEGDVTGFEICGENRIFFPAKARIVGHAVRVWNDSITNPAGVRYGWKNVTDANLMNSEGLPAAPFRMQQR